MEWNTNEWWVPADKTVDAVIWDAHGYLNTTCGGVTQTNDLVDAGWIFRRWRYNCSFGLADTDVFFVRDIIRGGYTFILSAQAKWQTLGLPGDEGHSVRWADGIAWGTPTRYGNMSAQMKQFVDTMSRADHAAVCEIFAAAGRGSEKQISMAPK